MVRPSPSGGHTPAAVPPRGRQIRLLGRQIRLLDISQLRQSPTSSTAPMSLAFKFHDLDDCPPFTALSYTWGNPRSPRRIFLNGQPTAVRATLYAFLTQGAPVLLKATDGAAPHYLWVDAVCINQEDSEERNSQVALMRDIYSKASQVAVWLGTDDAGHGSAAFDFISRHPATPAAPGLPASLRRWTWAMGMALRALCQRPYWQRVWIVQEATLATKITLFWGAHACSFDHLRRFLATLADEHAFGGRLETVPFATDIAASAAAVVVDIKAASRGGSAEADFVEADFWSMVERCRDCRCTDRRDHLFGLLGLVSQRELARVGISADYTKTPDALYRYVLTNYFVHSGGGGGAAGESWDGAHLRRYGALLQDVLGLDARTGGAFLELGQQLLPQLKLRWRLRIRTVQALADACRAWAALGASPPGIIPWAAAALSAPEFASLVRNAAVPENGSVENSVHVQSDMAGYSAFLAEIQEREAAAKAFRQGGGDVPADYYAPVCSLIVRILVHTNALYLLYSLGCGPPNARIFRITAQDCAVPIRPPAAGFASAAKSAVAPGTQLRTESEPSWYPRWKTRDLHNVVVLWREDADGRHAWPDGYVSRFCDCGGAVVVNKGESGAVDGAQALPPFSLCSHGLCSSGLTGPIDPGQRELAAFLVGDGTDSLVRLEDRLTALVVAAQDGRGSVVRQLLQGFYSAARRLFAAGLCLESIPGDMEGSYEKMHTRYRSDYTSVTDVLFSLHFDADERDELAVKCLHMSKWAKVRNSREERFPYLWGDAQLRMGASSVSRGALMVASALGLAPIVNSLFQLTTYYSSAPPQRIRDKAVALAEKHGHAAAVDEALPTLERKFPQRKTVRSGPRPSVTTSVRVRSATEVADRQKLRQELGQFFEVEPERPRLVLKSRPL